MLGHADAERGQLLFQNGREGVLNAAAGDLAAGRDNGSGFQPVGQQLKDRLACGDAVGGVELFLFDNERNDARAAELVSGVDGSVGMPRGDHQLVDHVDGVELFHVHAEQAVALGAQLDLALLDLTARHMLIFADGAQALGGVVFMEHSRLHLPDVEMLLAHREQHRNVLFGDDVSLAELRALEFTGHDARQVVAEHMADGVFRFNQFHGISSRTVIRSPF